MDMGKSPNGMSYLFKRGGYGNILNNNCQLLFF